MAESKILNNAARILQLVAAGTPADVALRDSLTQNRHVTAPLERRSISRAVFTYYRWRRWLKDSDSAQKQLAAALALQERFNQDNASIKPEALAARAVPDWLKAEVDNVPPAWLTQLQREPVLWIRTKEGLESKVTADLKNCVPAELGAYRQPSTAYRYTGLTDLYRTSGFQAGEFEIQDLASQLVGHAANPQPGETWWDACAGEGGKSMHLSDLMQNKGLLWVSDRSLRRLAKLKERAARGKVFNFRAAPWEGGANLPTKTKFDGILLDAPCSGIGTWQRNPHARWTAQPTDVHELAAVQLKLLNHVAGSLKPGGRLVYAVCTLSRAETTGVAEAFTESHPELEPTAVWTNPRDQKSEVSIGSLTSDLRPLSSVTLWPQGLNANGMFIAAWKKR